MILQNNCYLFIYSIKLEFFNKKKRIKIRIQNLTILRWNIVMLKEKKFSTATLHKIDANQTWSVEALISDEHLRFKMFWAEK